MKATDEHATKQEKLEEGICIVCGKDDVECLNNCTKHVCISCGVHQEQEACVHHWIIKALDKGRNKDWTIGTCKKCSSTKQFNNVPYIKFNSWTTSKHKSSGTKKQG